MNICLINPPRLLEKYLETLKSTPPLGLAYIAGTLQKLGHSVTIIDAMAEAPLNTYPFMENVVVNGMSFESILDRIPVNTQMIGFHFMFSNNWLLFRELSNIIGQKFPHIVQIAGGEHVTALPELCIEQAKHLKVCVLGEGEETVEEVVNAIEHNTDFEQIKGICYRNSGGEIKTTARRTRIRKLEEIPWPAWNLFPMEKYREHKMSWGVIREGQRSLPVMATRGCPYECTFCSSPNMWGVKYNMRPPAEMVDEIQFLKEKYAIENFDFYDLTAVINKHWIIEFSKELINRKLDITWQIPAGTRSEVIDYEVARYLYLSGCRNITYAPESGSERILEYIKKKVRIPNMLNSMAQSRRAGLNIKLNMIIGFPEEKHSDIWKTLWFLIKCSWYGVNDMFPSVFSPYPGSELFNQLKAEGKVNEKGDVYFKKLIFLDSFSRATVYNKHMHKNTIYLYQVLFLLVFYFSNFLFRPWRPFISAKNIMLGQLESKAEYQLHGFLERIIKLKTKNLKLSTKE